MLKSEIDSLPGGAAPSNAPKLMEAARLYRGIEQRAYNSFSGADRADAPKHGLTADALACIALGKDVDAVLALCQTKWAAYCAENNAKVAAASKIKRGPMAGHSSIHYRHVSVESWDSVARFVRQMVTV